MRLFEYAVIFHPTEKEKKDGLKDEIIVPPTYTLADSKETAALKAARAIPKEQEEKLAQLEVLIRPFA